MMQVTAMGQLMDNEIVDHGEGGLNEPPIEGHESILAAEA